MHPSLLAATCDSVFPIRTSRVLDLDRELEHLSVERMSFGVSQQLKPGSPDYNSQHHPVRSWVSKWTGEVYQQPLPGLLQLLAAACDAIDAGSQSTRGQRWVGTFAHEPTSPFGRHPSYEPEVGRDWGGCQNVGSSHTEPGEVRLEP